MLERRNIMCMYCERRKDVKFGWKQPNLPWHNNFFGENSDGCGTLQIPIKYCPECGRQLGKKQKESQIF